MPAEAVPFDPQAPNTPTHFEAPVYEEDQTPYLAADAATFGSPSVLECGEAEVSTERADGSYLDTLSAPDG